MNAVDATDRTEEHDEAEAPSLLTIILDTNPHAWNLLADTLPLSKAVANLLVFINAHLAINHANRVAVIASHIDCAVWLYPTPAAASRDTRRSTINGSHDEDTEMNDDNPTAPGGPVQPQDDANKYRPFAHIEHALLTNLRRLLATTTPETLTTTPSTRLAGALTLALTHISKQTLTPATGASASNFNYADPTSLPGTNDLNPSATANTNTSANLTLTARILLLSVSGDLALQYIPLMNSIFACQRLSIPVDILKLAGDPVFLQQAADATGGVYIALTPSSLPGLLQYLMFAFLPDQAARRYLIAPGEGEGVDFRAACFCHRKIVDVGYVCSICLSIFCEVLEGGHCLTCGSALRMGEFGRRPVVVPRVRRKKKRGADGAGAGTGTGSAGRGTPVPG